jgi:uncharacterized membrane protein YdfJ with MMPL/SSD domain
LARFLHRAGFFIAHHKWVVLFAWLLLVALMVTALHTLGSNTSNNLELPGTDSQAATDLLAKRFPPQQNGKSPIVFYAKDGKVTDADKKQAIETALKNIEAVPHVNSANDPFGQTGAGQISKDQKTAFIPVLLSVGGDDLTEPLAERLLHAAEKPGHAAGMEVAAGGPVGTELSEPDTASSDVIGLMAAMIILAFTFGSLVAMGLPLLSAVLGLLVGLSLIGLLGHIVNVPTIAPTLATMIGLGVGIDYALFMVNRHRAGRAEGLAVDESIATALATSGSAIVYAGGTVVLALVTLLVAGIPLVTSLGYSSALAVITAVAAAITLLPAVLALVGEKIDSVRMPSYLRPKPKDPDKGFWGGWARWVTGHPWGTIALSLALLLPLMIPFLSLDLGQEDVGATPKSTQERKAYDLMARGFGEGYNGPLLIAVSLAKRAAPSQSFEQQYTKAQNLNTKLSSQQVNLQARQQDLEFQAAALQAEQSTLLAQQAELESQGSSLKTQKRVLRARARQLKKQRTILAQVEPLVRQAAQLTKQEAHLAAQAEVLHKAIAKTKRPRVKARLQARLDAVTGAQATLKDQAAVLKAELTKLERQAKKLGGQTAALVKDAANAAKSALTLVKAKNALQLTAAQAQTQAANLKTQKTKLQFQAQEAQRQGQEATNLKTELTAELTAAGGDQRGTDTRLVNLQNAMTGTIGVKLVSPPQINKKGDAAIFSVIATTAPADPKTADVVTTLRDYVIPQSTHGTDLKTDVGGQTASYVDLATGITDKLGLVIFAVIALGFLVLMMAFRSVLIPGQAALGNVLSVIAAFGVVTAVFQLGWGTSLLGLDGLSGGNDVPIASFVPLIMFAVLFGLSMDYQVFLMSQIEHARARTKDDREAIALGLATGARVIAAAALIMMSVFGSFILNGDPTVKQFGVGLAVGVALAAITVLTFAPAVLVLAGKGAWWVPNWADRFLPKIDIEGTGESSEPPAKPYRGGSMKL